MRNIKRLSIISLVLVLALSFTGCTRSSEVALYQAFQKTLDINSMESTTEISFTIDGEGLDEASQMMLEEAKTTLNSSKFYMDQKTSTNEEGTKGKAQIDLKADMGGVKTDMGVWVDMDYTGKNAKMVEIIKMPQMLMAGFGPEVAGKEYIVLDLNDMASEEGSDMDFSKIVDLSKDLQPKMEEFMKNYFNDFELDEKLVTYTGKHKVDGKELSMYNIKLDDESLKNLLRSTVNYSLDNEENEEFLKDYMKVVSTAVEMAAPQDQISKEEIANELEELEGLAAQLPEFKDVFNEFMDNSKDVKIIGNKGISIEYGVDSKGYIVSEKASIDLRIDLGAISKAMLGEMEGIEGMEDMPMATGVINLGINSKSNIKNINGELKVEIPKTNKENSIDYKKLMEIQMKQLEQMDQFE